MEKYVFNWEFRIIVDPQHKTRYSQDIKQNIQMLESDI